MLNLGTINGVNLSLISPFTSSNGDIYYFVDGNGDRSPTDTPGATYDAILRQRLDDLFNSGSDTNATSRSVVIEGTNLGDPSVSYRLTLPTSSELAAIRTQNGGPPTGWANASGTNVATYHTADSYGSDRHSIFGLTNGQTYSRVGLEEDSISSQFVAIKVETILNPVYTLTASLASVSEGSTATFTLSTTNVASGTSVFYSI